ncbi:MAG: copper amine oxidase N-terminal domain-containing protein [Tissierellia bacterium]|nr:copper amine oxidase N-terminal domain-containing protein [Tissierellia bacterium]
MKEKCFAQGRFLWILGCALVVLATLGAPRQVRAGELPGPEIYLHGEKLVSDVAPLIHGDRTMVPLRLLSEKLGYEVTWDQEGQRVAVIRGGEELVFQIGKREVTHNGWEETLDVAPILREDRTFVPLRYIGERFGQVVLWDHEHRRVHFTRDRVEPKKEEDFKYRLVLINDSALPEANSKKRAPEQLQAGDVGIVLKAEGEELFVDLIRPVGDLPEDWSFARGYVPRKNVILMPTPQEYEILATVTFVREGKVTLEDAVTGEKEVVDGNFYAKVKKKEENRLLIERPGGANDAWVSTEDGQYYFENFTGNPGWEE